MVPRRQSGLACAPSIGGWIVYAMTSLSTSTVSSPAARGDSFRGFRLRAGDKVLAALIAAAFLGLFFRWMVRQFGVGGFSADFFEDWGHAYIVPFISIAALWQRRQSLAREPIEVCWPGLGVLLLGIVSYLYFIMGYSNHMFQGFAMILALAGLCLFLLGPRIFPSLVFPLAYLGFAVTISEMVMNVVTFRLRLMASQGAWVLLNVIGVDTDLAGNTLEVHNGGQVIPLNVADACAGMRMVVAFAALAVAVGFLSCRRWWQRIAVVLLAIPVALLMNVVRVAVLGIASLFNPSLASGGAHTFIGTLLLIPAFFLFMGCVWLLQKIDSGVPAPAPAPAKKGDSR